MTQMTSILTKNKTQAEKNQAERETDCCYMFSAKKKQAQQSKTGTFSDGCSLHEVYMAVWIYSPAFLCKGHTLASHDVLLILQAVYYHLHTITPPKRTVVGGDVTERRNKETEWNAAQWHRGK